MKLIGTGKDPRYPEGVDFDVREEDAEKIIANGEGKPLEDLDHLHSAAAQLSREESPEPAFAAVGPDIADGDAGRAKGTPQDPNHPARSGAPVEGDEGSSDGTDGEESAEALGRLKRDDLNSRASDAGVEDPESYPNKEALVKAIRDAEAADQE